MTTRKLRHLVCVLGVTAVAAAAALVWRWPAGAPDRYTAIDRPPRIHPDYAGVTLPPNIAPTNFVVDEPGQAFRVRVSGGESGFTVAGDGNRIALPEGPWKELLAGRRGQSIDLDVYARDAAGAWSRFRTIRNDIAPEPIDSHLVVRMLNPAIHAWYEIGLFERDLESFHLRRLIDNSSLDGDCCNCHTFRNNRPDTMLFHVRSEPVAANAGMVVYRDGQLTKLDTRTSFRRSPAGFASWHPTGKIAAFSVNRIKLFSHTAGPEVREQIDVASDLAIYDFRTGLMSYPPSLALDDMQETYPCWSPDGRTLYFCRTPVAWPEPWTRTPVPENFRTIQYDLMKVSFDIETGKWGEVETLLTAKSLGLSLLEPRVSPDGRFLMFVATQYGDVAIYHKDGDLYLLELATGKFRRMECNSDNTEGWHSWSSNGRWIAFTSRRDNSLYARTYFAYVDGRGVSRKAFVLPQEDGAYYDSLLLTYNLPELITGPVPASEKDLVRTVRTRAIGPSSMPVTGATPKRGQGSAGDQ